MESHSAADTIQITRATYELIRDKFTCQPQGRITVKGKGEMEVWYVVGQRPSVAVRAASEMERPAEAVS